MSDEQKSAEPSSAGNGLDLEDDIYQGGFFTPLVNRRPYVKAALDGFQGSGKTFTAARIAIWLWKRLDSRKPIAFVDNEESAKFLIPQFEKEKIPILHKESASITDLNRVMRMMRDDRIADILLIDSTTKIWDAFVASFMRQKKKNNHRLDLSDWGPLKALWRQEFTDPIVHDPFHVIFTGRAAYTYNEERNEETGKWESHKASIKMRAESETGYEPDLLVYMETHDELIGQDKVIYRTATVVKDRADLIDGKTFRNPKPEDFKPALEAALANAMPKPRPIESDDGHLFASEDDKRDYLRRRDILVEEIEAELVATWPGQTAEDKQQKILAVKAGFGTAAWTWIKMQRPELLAGGKDKILAYIAGRKQDKRDAVNADGPAAGSAHSPRGPRNGVAAGTEGGPVETPTAATAPNGRKPRKEVTA